MFIAFLAIMTIQFYFEVQPVKADGPGTLNYTYQTSEQLNYIEVNDDYIWVGYTGRWILLDRSDLTVVTSVPCPDEVVAYESGSAATFTATAMDDSYFYAGGKSDAGGSLQGWYVIKYNMPSLTATGDAWEEDNWRWPEFMICNDTYIFGGGAKTNGGDDDSGLIKLKTSDLTYACPSTSYSYSDLYSETIGHKDYNYRYALSPDEQWLYTACGVKDTTNSAGDPGFIGKADPSDLSHEDHYHTSNDFGIRYNLQNIVCPTNDRIIASTPPGPDDSYEGKMIVCVDSDMEEIWKFDHGETRPGPNKYRYTFMENYNATNFLTCRYDGTISVMNVSDGGTKWNYSGVFDSNVFMTKVRARQRYMYILGEIDGTYTVHNVTVSNEGDVQEEEEEHAPKIQKINAQDNDTTINTPYRYFNWTKNASAIAYHLVIVNNSDGSPDWSDEIVNLTNITVSAGACTNTWLNETADSASPKAYNYWEASDYCHFYLPYVYNITYYEVYHYYRVRAQI